MAGANISNESSLKLNNLKFTTSILDLPNEVLVKIFSMLCQEDILKNMAKVCKRFLEISRTPEVLPIIRSSDTFVNLLLPRKIQNCMKIYPRSKMEIEIKQAEYSALNLLREQTTGTIASFVKYMSIELLLDDVADPRSFPMFENLEFLHLNDIAPLRLKPGTTIFMYRIPRFWSHFPNLTYLYINAIHILRGIVGFHKYYYLLNRIKLNMFPCILILDYSRDYGWTLQALP